MTECLPLASSLKRVTHRHFCLSTFTMWNVWHSPHSALLLRFIRGKLPSKPKEPHTGYTQSWRGAYRTAESRASVRHKVPVTAGLCKWIGGHGSQTRQPQWQQAFGGVEVQQSSECGPVVQPASSIGWLEV